MIRFHRALSLLAPGPSHIRARQHTWRVPNITSQLATKLNCAEIWRTEVCFFGLLIPDERARFSAGMPCAKRLCPG